jgi:hypothetical protein
VPVLRPFRHSELLTSFYNSFFSPGRRSLYRTRNELYIPPLFFGRAHEERELRFLVKQPDAAARMRWLIAHGTPEGQMYGLYGLRLLKDPEFEQFASQLEEQPG